MANISTQWKGVYPAATTQFAEDLSIDIAATQSMIEGLIADGVHGVVALGTVGENNSLTAQEKRTVLRAIVETANGRVPVIAGVSELTTAAAAAYAVDAEKAGVDGLMALPAMVYVPMEHELEKHFSEIAKVTALPIMLYNNPSGYRVNIGIETLTRLADHANIVAVKESSSDSRRFTDLFNALGSRFAILAGLDDLAFEGLALGAVGWVSGLTNAFPAESLALYEALAAGDLVLARTIYRWFMPLLHLDAEHDLVQSIKLAEQVMGRGSERVRPPRYALEGARREAIIQYVEAAAATRPTLA